MNRRVQLTWPRVNDEDIVAYRVYRSTKANVTRNDTMIMEVEQKNLPEPIPVTRDKLVRSGDEYEVIYQARYTHIMPEQEEYPIKLYLNGISMDLLSITYGCDYDTGEFVIDTNLLENDEVTADYYIDSIRVYDTDEVEQKGVKYTGPTARDYTENTVPTNVSILSDEDNGRIVLRWKDCDTQGQDYFYRVESIDAYGNFSVLSVEASAFIREGLATEGYIIERSYDNGVSWQAIAKTSNTEYFEYGIDENPPLAPLDLIVDRVDLLNGTSKANVTLKWREPPLGITSVTGQYRIRSQSTLGVISVPSVTVGPVYLTSNIGKYVVRRKVYDGSLPTYDGNDAITIASAPKNRFTITDYGVPDNEQYVYAVYAVDAANNISIAATIVTEIYDATPPEKVTGFTAMLHDYIIKNNDIEPPGITNFKVMKHGYVIGVTESVPPHIVTSINGAFYYNGL